MTPLASIESVPATARDDAITSLHQLDFSPLARGPARGLLACHVTEIKIMNALEVAQGEPNRGGIRLGPKATWEIPDSRTQGSERDENFAPFHIKTLIEALRQYPRKANSREE